MAIIRVTCPSCGQIELHSDHVELVSIPGRPIDRDNTHYTFTCTVCDTIVRRPADRITATVLTSAGVRMRAPRHPVLLGRTAHPEDPPDGPPFDLDDLLDLHLLLEDDGWFDALASSRRSAT